MSWEREGEREGIRKGKGKGRKCCCNSICICDKAYEIKARHCVTRTSWARMPEHKRNRRNTQSEKERGRRRGGTKNEGRNRNGMKFCQTKYGRRFLLKILRRNLLSFVIVCGNLLPFCSSFPPPPYTWLSLKLENGVGAYKAKSIE